MNTKCFYPNDLVLRANPDGKLNIWDRNVHNRLILSAIRLADSEESDIESAKHLMTGADICLDNGDIENTGYLLSKALRFVEDLSRRRNTLFYAPMLYDIALRLDRLSIKYGETPYGYTIMVEDLMKELARRRARSQRAKRPSERQAKDAKASRRS